MNIKQDFDGHIRADFEPSELPKVVSIVRQMEAGRIETQRAADAETLKKMQTAQDSVQFINQPTNK